MESKTKTKKVNKVEVFVESIRNESRFDVHEVIKETDDKAVIVTGYSNHNHSKLIEYNFKTKHSDVLKVNGNVPFSVFVKNVKKQYADSE